MRGDAESGTSSGHPTERKAVTSDSASIDVDALHARILHLPPGPRVPWFLDVDGVLNIETGVPSGPGAWPTYQHTTLATSRQPNVSFTWSPHLIDCLNLLVARRQIQVHWLTSWDLDAPLCAAPAIGLHAGHVVARDVDDIGTEWWKLRVIRQFVTTSDFYIWTDDYINDATSTATVHTITDGKAFTVCPDPGTGLSPEQLNLIITAIAQRRTKETHQPSRT
jgi:hypothetical protein